MHIYWWAETDVGKVREKNEDSYLVAPEHDLYLLADGMGGHVGGKEASSMAVEGVKSRVLSGLSQGEKPSLNRFAEALKETNHAIYEKSATHPEFKGMGTTFTGLWRDNNHGHILHVGDSRLYHFRDGSCEQISVDHTWVNEQLRAGYITEEEAKRSKFKSVITRSVGFESEIRPDAFTVPLRTGDVFLLCSDGLSNHFSQHELQRLFSFSFYSRLPSLLIDTALARGGEDNITLIILYVAAS